MENRSTLVRGRTSATWALGSLAVFFFVVEVLTGLAVAFYYRPATGLAHASVLDLREASYLGWVAEIHYWGSHALIVVVWLHLVRTFVTGSYKSGHRRDWTIGVVLLVPVLLLAATGSWLPMDRHGAPGTAEVPPALGEAGTGAGAAELETDIGDSDLWRLYVLHCLVLPAVAAVLVVVHVRRSRLRAGGEADRSP